MNSRAMKVRASLSAIVALIGTGALLGLSLGLAPQKQHDLGVYFVYQVITLGLALAAVLAMWLISGRNLAYFRKGELRAAARPIRILGVTEKDSWWRVGWTFTVIVSAVTLIFMLLSTWNQLSTRPFQSYLLAFACAIPLSAVNAFNEEIITRWTIAEGFTGSLARFAPWASAIIFGSVHFFGTPGGLIGCLMAAFLAWLATRSIQDSRGLGWAWIIHFVQDVIIFTITLTALKLI